MGAMQERRSLMIARREKVRPQQTGRRKPSGATVLVVNEVVLREAKND
jgi:hypothetical protein